MPKNDIEYLAYVVLEKAPLSNLRKWSDPALSTFIRPQSLGQNKDREVGQESEDKRTRPEIKGSHNVQRL